MQTLPLIAGLSGSAPASTRTVPGRAARRKTKAVIRCPHHLNTASNASSQGQLFPNLVSNEVLSSTGLNAVSGTLAASATEATRGPSNFSGRTESDTADQRGPNAISDDACPPRILCGSATGATPADLIERARRAATAQRDLRTVRVPEHVEGDTYRLPVGRNGSVLISGCDVERLVIYAWSLTRNGCGLQYAAARINGRTVTMHRFLVQPRDGLHVDHINGDTLDNRRENLRACTQQENNRNRHERPGTKSLLSVVQQAAPHLPATHLIRSGSVRVNGVLRRQTTIRVGPTDVVEYTHGGDVVRVEAP
jgi:hypothetical protein